jgi:hypothetical protein
MATDALQTRLIEARAYIANLTQTLNRLEREATLASSSDDDEQAAEQPFSVRVKGDAKLWRTDKRNGLTAAALCKRHEDFHWLFDMIFDEDFRVPATDENGACTVPRLSVKDIMAAIMRLYDRNEFVRDIYDRYALAQPLSLGYRAWMSYLTARSSFMRMENGAEYWYGLRVKDIAITDTECQDGNFDKDADDIRLCKDIKKGKLTEFPAKKQPWEL